MARLEIAPGFRTPQTRNPFAGKGLRVSFALLTPREWGIRELAAHTEASPALVSMVLRELRQLDLVDGGVVQGRTATVQGTQRLARELALHWPTAEVGILGKLPADGTIGGGPAHRAVGITTMTKPRVYVRSVPDAKRVLAWWGGLTASPQAGDYELCILDVPLETGLVPPIVVALELGGTPRGRETLDTHAARLLEGLPE